MSQIESLLIQTKTYRTNIRTITRAKSENNCICAPQDSYKKPRGSLHKPITKNGYIKYKKAIDYAFLACFKANVPTILKVPESLDFVNI